MKLRTLLVVKTISKVLFIYLKEDQNMNNTALGAENKKEQTINFISEAHEKFYYEKLKEVRYQDVYHKGLKGKKGSYDAYLIPQNIEEFSYTKDCKKINGFQYKFKMEFP